MSLRVREYFKLFRQGYLHHSVIYIFILCGIAGMLVDIDHLPKILYLLMGGQGDVSGRPLHPLFFLIASCICIYIGVKLFGDFIKYHTIKEN